MNVRPVSKARLLEVKHNFWLQRGQWVYVYFRKGRIEGLFEFNFTLHVTSNFLRSMFTHLGRDGVVGIANHYELDRPDFELWWVEDIFSSLYPVRLALRPIQPPLKQVLGLFLTGVWH
jgi:hypothetical protein